jgi:MFS superfamily sulfate permease-like transporter
MDDPIAIPADRRDAGAAEHRNRFDRLEWAGAFGDLGTLIPFVVAYITVLGIDPLGVLLSFGICMIVSGAYYRTPFPVQPMKAIGAVATTQAAQTAIITPAAVHGAALFTGVLWLILGLTGATRRIAGLVCRPVAVGIILGLGLGFMLDGIRLMAETWLISGAALLLTLLLLANRIVPAMFLLLVGGAAVALLRDPSLASALLAVELEPRLPTFALAQLTWSDLFIGIAFLALPQLPLTLGNAVIAITEENNRLFPRRPVSEKRVSISTGLMNLFSGGVGGVPMCHGAGGMAGHVRFGARTGGSLIILGCLLLLMAVFLSPSVHSIFRIIPKEILGVILFMTGAQLALGSCDFGKEKQERFAAIVTAALAMWNVGLAFVAGLAVYHLLKRGWVRL